MDWQTLTLFLYITARISGAVLFNPLIGRTNIPGMFRAGLVLMLSVFTISMTQQTALIPGSILELMVRILLELFLGFILGMVVQFFLYIPQLAGHVIDTQMAMTMNQIYDSGSQSNMSVTGVLLNALMVLLFFAANGHHTLFRIIITSGECVPFGAVSFEITAMVNALLELFLLCTVLAVKLCMPILAAELLGQLGMGILMKVIPQINVFSINIELKVIIGLLLLLLLLSPISEFLLQAETTMLSSLSEIMQLAAPS